MVSRTLCFFGFDDSLRCHIQLIVRGLKRRNSNGFGVSKTLMLYTVIVHTESGFKKEKTMNTFEITSNIDYTPSRITGYENLEKVLLDMSDPDAYEGENDETGETYTTRDIIHKLVLRLADGEETDDLEDALDLEIKQL